MYQKVKINFCSDTTVEYGKVAPHCYHLMLPVLCLNFSTESAHSFQPGFLQEANSPKNTLCSHKEDRWDYGLTKLSVMVTLSKLGRDHIWKFWQGSVLGPPHLKKLAAGMTIEGQHLYRQSQSLWRGKLGRQDAICWLKKRAIHGTWYT